VWLLRVVKIGEKGYRDNEKDKIIKSGTKAVELSEIWLS
jgi:hypothetical protein